MGRNRYALPPTRRGYAAPLTSTNNRNGPPVTRQLGSGQIVSFADEPNGSVEQPTSARPDPTRREDVLKKISYLLASAVSALAATLPVSSIAATPDVAVRDPSAATELARPADTIRVSQ